MHFAIELAIKSAATIRPLNQRKISMYDYIKLLHLTAGIVWLGGMTFMLFALRPAALATLESQSRALLMGQVWRRFFALVLAAIALLFTTGTISWYAS